VIGHEANAEMQLTGTALNTAQTGERVAVRAGLSGAILHGRVLGAGVVELEPVKGRE
jgi:flagella basal body P-ring formation protein FlgA